VAGDSPLDLVQTDDSTAPESGTQSVNDLATHLAPLQQRLDQSDRENVALKAQLQQVTQYLAAQQQAGRGGEAPKAPTKEDGDAFLQRFVADPERVIAEMAGRMADERIKTVVAPYLVGSVQGQYSQALDAAQTRVVKEAGEEFWKEVEPLLVQQLQGIPNEAIRLNPTTVKTTLNSILGDEKVSEKFDAAKAKVREARRNAEKAKPPSVLGTPGRSLAGLGSDDLTDEDRRALEEMGRRGLKVSEADFKLQRRVEVERGARNLDLDEMIALRDKHAPKRQARA
jgi:hypothetical protein